MDDSVLIVGAGPSGLTCAIALARQGVRLRIFDQGPGVRDVSRAVVIQPRTVELYRQIDPELANSVIREGQLCSGINFWIRGRKKASIVYADVSSGANASPVSQPLVLPQNFHERALIRYLENSLGIQVEWGMTVTDVNVEETRAVWVDAGKTEHTAQFAFIVGADGSHSMVRQCLGSKFEGSTSPERFFIADIRCEALPQPTDGLHLHQGSDDFMFMAPYAKPGRARIVGNIAHDQQVASFDDIKVTSLDELQLQVKEVAWFSTYKIAHRVADVWQRGKVAIVGDAAHVHSPVGGQGMNTGIGDSINLAWKIAAVLKDEAAPSTLLPTYTAERRSFAVKLVATTDRVFSWTTPGTIVGDIIRLYVFPTIAAFLWSIHFVRQKVYATTAQFNLNYRVCDFNTGGAGVLGGGDRLPYHPLQDNWKALNDLKWHLQTFGSASADNEALAAWCTKHHVMWDRFEIDEKATEVGFTDGCCLLVRPDMYIGHAGVMQDDASQAVTALEDYWQHRMTGLGSQ